MQQFNLVEEPLSGVEARNSVEQADGRCIIRFWAPWCISCRVNQEIIKNSLRQIDVFYKIFSVNVDREPELARSMGIKYIPETIIFDRKRNKHHLTGELTKESILKLIG